MKDFVDPREAQEAQGAQDAPRSQGGRPTILLAATLIIGFGLGILVGRVTAPERAAQPTDAGAAVAKRVAEKEEKSEGPGLGVIAGLAKQAEDFIESSDEAKGLAAMGDLLSHASMTDILDWSRDPQQVTGRIINEMSDEELTSLITSVIQVTPEQLGEYADVRDYANRLSHIAMSGMITDDISEEFDGIDLQVTFATDASSSRGPEDPSTTFPEDTRKIYAVIENAGDVGRNIMVHWYRVDQPQKLLFDQFRVSPNDNYSYVWLKRPDRRWEAGEYRVEFFSADEFLAPIASGTYRVVAQ